MAALRHSKHSSSLEMSFGDSKNISLERVGLPPEGKAFFWMIEATDVNGH